MDFKEAFNLTNEMTHTERYTTIINGLGYESVKRCIPFSLEEIRTALKTDKNLNNLPLSIWDRATGFKSVKSVSTGKLEYIPHNSVLLSLCRNKGITCYSLSELVCILKRCAVMWVEEDNKTKGREKNEPDETGL